MRRTCASSTAGCRRRFLHGQVEQRVVGHAAPEEERQPRRQLDVADPVGRAGRRRSAGSSSTRKMNVGLARRRRSASWMPVSKSRFSRPSGRTAAADPCRLRDRPAVGAARQRGQNLRRASLFLARRRCLGPAHEIRRRLGVSPAPVGLNGPAIVSVSMCGRPVES